MAQSSGYSRTSLHLVRVVVVCLSIGSAGASAGEIRGRAEVRDGDSIVIEGLQIRLHGIDAPEYNQTCNIDDRTWACGRTAKRALKQMLGSAIVRCTWSERDTYHRAIGTCYRDGMNINAELVRHGLALAYHKYSSRYANEQAQAKTANSGLWRSQFVPPWLWRRDNRAPSKR